MISQVPPPARHVEVDGTLNYNPESGNYTLHIPLNNMTIWDKDRNTVIDKANATLHSRGLNLRTPTKT